MASINLIKVTETLSEGRFDAEYFHPKYHLLDSTLHSLENKTKLGTISNFIKKGIFDISPKKYRTTGIPLIRTTQIKSLISNEDNLIYIDKEEHLKNQIKTELLSGDIVFTKIGAGIGDVAILNKQYTNYNFSQNVAGASIKRDKINPYYLICFLNSYYGREQIMRFMMPSGQGKLELKDIKKIQIFRTEFEDKIADLIVKAEYTANQSQTLYKQATDLLVQELGLDKINFEKPKSYKASFSEVVTTIRLDSNHFQPKFKQLEQHLKENFVTKKIGYLVSCNRRGLQPNYNSNGEIDVVNSKHITATHLKYDSFEKTALANYKICLPAQIQEGDILIYTTGAYVGQTNVYLSKNPALASNHVNILRLKDPEIDSTYVALVLNNIIGKMQTEQHIRGSAQAELYPNDIAKFFVPILDLKIMKTIGELVRNSLKATQESQKLLANAKARVEQLIEEAANK